MYRVTLINNNVETVIHSELALDSAPRLAAGVIKKGINTINSFSFTILPNNPGYEKIFAQKTLIEVLNVQTNKLEFEGRILLPTEKMEESGLFTKNVVCEDEMGYLQDSAQRYGEYRNTPREFLQIIIDNHNRQVEKHKRFEVGIVDVTNSTDNVYRYLGYEKTFPSIKDKLLDRLGGELRVRKENGVRLLDWVTQIGEEKSTEIRISKNLKSIEREQDPTEIITRLVPLGMTIDAEEGGTEASKPRLTISSINNGLDYIDDIAAIEEFGIIEASVTWDDVTLTSNLLRNGEDFLQANNRIKKKFILSALDLFVIGLDIDTYEVGNWYPVINPVMGIDESLRVIEKSTDILNPYNSSLSIGDKFQSLSEYQASLKREQNEFVEVKHTVNAHSVSIGNLRESLENAQSDLGGVKTNLENAGSDISNINQTIVQLNELIDILDGHLTDLQYQIVTLEEFNSLAFIVEDNTQSISAITSTLNEMKQEIEVIKEQLGGEDNG